MLGLFTVHKGKSIYGKNIVNLEQIGTKGLSTVFISIENVEQLIELRGKSNFKKYTFFHLKFCTFTDDVGSRREQFAFVGERSYDIWYPTPK